MKRKLFLHLFFILIVLTNSVFAQITTKVFTLNLGKPSPEALKSSNSSTRLVLPSKCPLAFKLENGNPYKYRYVINSKLVNFFEGQVSNPLDSIGKFLAKTRESPKAERGPASTLGELKDSSYQSKATTAIAIITSEPYIANELNIQSPNPNSEDDDKIIILDALKILDNKFSSLNTNIEIYIANITTEDFLNQKDFVKSRTKFKIDFSQLLNNIAILNSEASDFSDFHETYSKNSERINKTTSEINVEIGKMFQPKLFNYLLPLDINGKNIDVVELTVERYDKTSTNPTPDKYVYNIWVRGGVKIDVSGGVFITSLMDKEYETKDSVVKVNNADETRKLIYEKNKGNFDFGFGSTINISLRGGSWVRPSLNLGALFTANQKFQILTGIGIILGKEERVVLQGGLSMGTTSKISDNFKSDGSIAYNLGTSGQISVTDKFSFGKFFGVTYNFGKTKAQEKTKE